MKYYLTQNRVDVDGCWQRLEEDGTWSYTTKLPKLLKAYPYFQIGISPDGSESIVATWEDVTELSEITQIEAQNQIDDWGLEVIIGQLDFDMLRKNIELLREQLREAGEING